MKPHSEYFLNGFGHFQVEGIALTDKRGCIGSMLDQGMFEEEFYFSLPIALSDQL
jgi:hypothetical protein